MRRSKVAAMAVSVALLTGACSGLGQTGDQGGGSDRQGSGSSDSGSKSGGSGPARADRGVVIAPNKGGASGYGRAPAPATSPSPKPVTTSPRASDPDREASRGK